MRRELFGPEHVEFQEKVREFIEKEIAPYHAGWERDGVVSREVWLAAGRAGLLGIEMDPAHGGGGDTDYRYYLALNEAMARAGAHGPGFLVHNDIVGHYFRHLCTPEQKERWLPGYCSGEMITALAITEPGAGSDLLGVRTTAVRDGDEYVLNGQKTFTTNGQLADLVLVVAKTRESAANPYLGFSMLAVERSMPGFTRGRNLDKIGMPAQDTSELFFDQVRVPRANLLGAEGGGFVQLMQSLRRERLALGAWALAAAEQVFEDTLAHCKTREVFGEPLGKLQHVRFQLAELATELAVARCFTDRAVTELNRGRLSADDAAMVKWWDTELCCRVADRCVQLHGGRGYLRETPVGRAFADTRVMTIFGGATEVMKEMVGRGLGL